MSSDQKSRSNALIDPINNYLTAAKDHYYELDPVLQLDKRATFEQNFKELALNNPLDTTSSEDLFAIYDAVSRRGGFKRIQDDKKWDDVVSSLSLYNFTPLSLENIYKNCLAKYEEKYYSESEDFVIKGSKIDKYFIPQIGSKGLYEGYFKSKPTMTETEIMKKLKIEHLDIYICFRNIIISRKEPNLSALLDIIPTTYHETFIKFFKVLFIYGVIDARKLKNISTSSFDLLNFPDLHPHKVTIVGANLRGIHCASLLRDFGFRVDIIDHQTFNKGKGPRFEEELYEQMPFNINSDPNNPATKFLNEMKLSYMPLRTGEILVVNINGDIVEKSTVEIKKNEFHGLLRNITNVEDKSLLFQDVLKEEMKNKTALGSHGSDLNYVNRFGPACRLAKSKVKTK